MKRIERFLEVADNAIRIFESGLSWEDKYGLIFSDEVSQALFKTGIDFDWLDLDTSYERDVTDFMVAVKSKAEELREALADQKEDE